MKYTPATFIFLSIMAGSSFAQDRASTSEKGVLPKCNRASVICRRSSSTRIKPFDGTVVFSLDSLVPIQTERKGRLILSAIVQITNESKSTLRSKVSHEWYGGVEPGTDLWMVVERCEDGKCHSEETQAYLVGNVDRTEDTIWQPGDSKRFEIRLNWPGTGSVPIEPLIDPDRPGLHKLKFVMFFRTGKKDYFLESATFDLTVQ